MKSNHIHIQKTARYFTLGELNENTEKVIFVIHGYAQLANYFLKKFEVLDNGKNFIVAPEGLHRFYWGGMNGRVVASWMTKEDRLADIDDYVSYLDSILEKLSPSCEIEIVGFSQGSATASRWIAKGHVKPNSLALWAGAFPGDINYFEDIQKFERVNIKLLIGDKDEYITIADAEKHAEKLKSMGLNVQFIQFEGKHNIYTDVLKEYFI